MKYFFYKYLLLIHVFKNIFSITPISEKKFLWQLHSYNDINELGQELRKGSTYFKIDLYFVLQHNCFTYDKRASQDSRGCFLLTHDSPIKGKYYYTVFEYFDRILYYIKNYQVNETKYIALCFKNTPNLICIYDYYDWIGLTTYYYNYIQNIISTNNLNLKITYDGDKLSCLYDLWPEWNYTWIRDRDPDEAFYSNEGTLYKFFVLNDKWINLEGDADLNWGKFNSQDMPLMVWEPSDQQVIQYVQNIFLKSPFEKGYAFAINIDSSMYQVYTGNISKENLNQHLINNYRMENIVYQIFDNKVFLFNNKYNVMKVFNISDNIMEEEFSFQNIYLPKNTLRNIIHFNTSNNNEKYLLITNKQLLYCFYKLNIESYLIEIKNCGLLYEEKNKKFKSLNIEIYDIDYYSENNLIFSFANPINKNNITFFILNYNIIDDNIIFINNSLNYNINFYSNIENIALKCLNKICLFLYKETLFQNISSYIIIYEKNEFQIKKYVNFGVGINFDLDIFQDPVSLKLKYFIVKDNAFCYHNNNQNKDAFLFVCEQRETNMKHVLNYIYGELPKDFKEIKDINKDYYSVCSTRIISGTYDMGDNPKIKTFIDENNNFSFIELHDGITEDMIDIHDTCGLSNFFEGIIADNWYIADFEINNLEYNNNINY